MGAVNISIHGHAIENYLIHFTGKHHILTLFGSVLNQNQSKIRILFSSEIETYPNDFILLMCDVFSACSVCHFLKQEITKLKLWFEDGKQSNTEQKVREDQISRGPWWMSIQKDTVVDR